MIKKDFVDIRNSNCNEKNKMKILHIPNYYPPNMGGIEKTASDCVRAFAHHFAPEQKVICMNRGARITKTDYDDKTEIIRCASPLKLFSQSLSIEFPKRLGRLMKEMEPDAVVLHWPNPFTAFWLMRHAERKFRFILYWHSDIVKQKMLGNLLKPLTEKTAARADVIIATSPDYVEGSSILSKYKKKVVIVPSCIDETLFQKTEETDRLAQKIRKENAGKTICFAFGREVPYKGFEYLYKALSYVDESVKLIHGKNLTQDELIAYLTACDIFCFPSITKNEAFGLALAEGMYFGNPAVTFSIPGSGVNYVSLNGITGIECPNRDSKAFAEAINKLAKDRKLRKTLGEQARKRVVNNFLYEQYAERICDRRIIPYTANDGDSEICERNRKTS